MQTSIGVTASGHQSQSVGVYALTAPKSRAEAARVGIWTADDLKERCFVDDADCWHWRGAMSKGRPRIWFGPAASVVTMGQVISHLMTGKKPRKNVAWRPVCTTPNCGNPAHNKPVKRSVYQAGRPLSPELRIRLAVINANNAKLSAESVDAIRASAEPSKVLSERFGVSVSYVNRIKQGKARAVIAGAGFSVFSWGG